MSKTFQPPRLPDFVESALNSPEPTWLVKDLIPAGGVCLLAGKPKTSKKSWLAMAVGMACASGKSVAGLTIPEAAPTLYVSLEGARKQTALRFKGLETGLGIDVARDCQEMYFQWGAPFLLTSKEQLANMARFVRSHGVKLVVLDTFARAFNGDENEVKAVSAAFSGVGSLVSQTGCSVLLVHHLRKEDYKAKVPLTDVQAQIRGSTAITGAVDTMLVVRTISFQDGSQQSFLCVEGKDTDTVGYEYDWDIKPVGGDRVSAKFTLGPKRELEDLEFEAKKRAEDA